MTATGTDRPLTPAGRRVLDTASRLFYQRGINTVGMELIAEQAGVTKKTVYDRFGSKDALVAAYLAERDRRWRAWVGEQTAAAGGPRERALAVFDALESWMEGLEPRGCAMVNACVELTDPDHPGLRVAREQKRWTRELFRGLAAEAGAADPDEAADTLLVLHEGAVIAYQTAGVRTAVRTARRAAGDLLSR
ncbi:TetR/AcrR family transcriptional regulator [Nocardiopsis composta]|uniref:AcrR family transcriptional regulator n=1 Tax=Nocardiopsis composta TaxID=157465 RepID=A0A7W8QPS4_9ACTN|nr:TetR/AcrR family transcriptional regulator [Nocardiopsis composta]MBB5433620.1 AcrR family transcriptional regulator [Nocardiopsis composta]